MHSTWTIIQSLLHWLSHCITSCVITVLLFWKITQRVYSSVKVKVILLWWTSQACIVLYVQGKLIFKLSRQREMIALGSQDNEHKRWVQELSRVFDYYDTVNLNPFDIVIKITLIWLPHSTTYAGSSWPTKPLLQILRTLKHGKSQKGDMKGDYLICHY